MIEAIVVGEEEGRLVSTHQRVLSWLGTYGMLSHCLLRPLGSQAFRRGLAPGGHDLAAVFFGLKYRGAQGLSRIGNK